MSFALQCLRLISNLLLWFPAACRCWKLAAMVKRSRCWFWERLLCQALTRTISASLLMSPWTQTMATSTCLTATAIPGSSHSHQRANICPTGEQVHTLPLKHCCYCVHTSRELLHSPLEESIKESIKHIMCCLCDAKWCDIRYVKINVYTKTNFSLKLGGLSGPDCICFCICL